VAALPGEARLIEGEVGGLEVVALQWSDAPVRTGEAMPLTLYLRGANPENPYLTLRAVHPVTQAVLGSVDVYPGMLPTDSTGGAGLLAVPLRLPITGEAAQPAQLQLLLGWEAPVEGEPPQRLLMRVGEATVDTIRLPGPVLLPETAAASGAQYPLDVVFSDVIRLDGYSLAHTDEGLNVTLDFTPLGPALPDTTLTVGIMSAAGQIIVQADGPLAGYPANAWLPGVALSEARMLALPDGVPDGATLFVGWYTLENGARLQVQHPQARDNLLFVTPR
jgi:hypothetical protein